MNKFMEQVKTFWADEDGLSAVEYVVAGSLIVGGLAGAFGLLGDAVQAEVEALTTTVSGGTTTP